MYSISDAVTTYKPGEGYTATIPGCPVTIRWGEEFLAQLRTAQQTSTNGEKNEARPEAPPRKTLTKEEIAALAAQYNPGKMTQAEYDAFLEDLVAQGVLSKEELGRLGYQGYAVVGSAVFDSNGFGSGSVSYAPDKNLPGQNPFNLYHSLLDANGDVLAWARVQSILNHSSSSPAHLGFLKGTQDAFQVMLEVLEAMQIQRDQ
ncbi:MAG: hypothetical protein K2P18_07190 [Oscillospiraceae bacterium]|nr:hypothetical protein [Oscillospiraceae bacterium]